MTMRTWIIGGSAAMLVACGAPDQPAEETGPASAAYRVETVAEGLEYPWSLAFLPGGDMLVTEKPGRLRMIMDGALLDEPIPGVPEVYYESQGGLLEVALAPDYADTGAIYLSYASGGPEANATALHRARFDGETLSGGETIWTAEPTKDTAVHYGGKIGFLADGTLLLTLGDGFEYREEAQRLDSHLGTIVRLNPDGSAPDDNPFMGDPNALGEIWSWGHRNVQGLVVDAGNDRVWAHEHGPRGGDELNLIEPGANYGWPVVTAGIDYSGARISPFEDHEAQGYAAPEREWVPSIAPSGMALYDGDLFPEWRGDLFIGALAGRALHRVDMEAGEAVGEEVLLADLDERIRDVRVGPDGAIYVLTDSDAGAVLRLAPSEDG